MVALRKDVKVGFVVGGIMLAVVGVYAALSMIGGRAAKPAAGETVKLQSTATDASRVAGATTPQRPAGATTDRPTPLPAPQASQSSSAVSSRGGAGDDVWSNAFNTGDLRPTRSVTPDLPSNTSRESAAKPADVIRALANPANPTPPQSTASTADTTSGSMAGGTTPPTLTRGIADPSAAKPTLAGGTGKTHVVVAGETLSAIADAEYGSAALYPLIVAANPNVDPARLKVGTSLTIPPLDKATPATPAAGARQPASANVDATKQYVVKPGDSLHKIAASLYGSTSEADGIYAANKQVIGDSPAKLKVGMTLTLPKPPTKKK